MRYDHDDQQINIYDKQLICIFCKNSCSAESIHLDAVLFKNSGRTFKWTFAACNGFYNPEDEYEMVATILGKSTSTEVY